MDTCELASTVEGKGSTFDATQSTASE
eukprot:COSAG06_NODE_51061_length_314_cov_1.204651_1_plen_26_part_10